MSARLQAAAAPNRSTHDRPLSFLVAFVHTACEPLDARFENLDADEDDFGGTTTAYECEAPEGYIAVSGDCDDSDDTVNGAVRQRATATTTASTATTYGSTPNKNSLAVICALRSRPVGLRRPQRSPP